MHQPCRLLRLTRSYRRIHINCGRAPRLPCFLALTFAPEIFVETVASFFAQDADFRPLFCHECVGFFQVFLGLAVPLHAFAFYHQRLQWCRLYLDRLIVRVLPPETNRGVCILLQYHYREEGLMIFP